MDVVDTKTIYNNFNVFKVESKSLVKIGFDELNKDKFIINFINFFRQRTTYHEMKTVFEKRDNYWTGYMDINEILRCFSLFKSNNDIKDEDILNFLNFSHFNHNDKVKYMDILDTIFKKPEEKPDDKLKKIQSLLNDEFK